MSDSQQEDSEGEQEDCIKRAVDVIEGVPIDQITAAIESIKKAKYNDNSGNGLISQNLDFKNAKEERFLLDTGATACIMGEKMARDNKIKIKNLEEPKSIHEASGARLDIIGFATFYVKLEAIKKIKQLTVFILRGQSVDREVLISVQMCRKYGIIHPTFPHESIKSYVNRKMKIKKVSAIYDKSANPTNVKVSEVPSKCDKLRQKILEKHAETFKEKLGKEVRVKIC